MIKPIDWISDALPSMDCPAAPFIDDFEDYFSTRLERLAETYPPISESGLQVHGATLNVVLGD
jgi:hypothetical protein